MKLLLLHPLPFDGSIFSNNLAALTDGCFAPALYESGETLFEWAEAALDAVGDGPVVVVGNSIGGSCAIEVARSAPAKVQALVLCGTKPGHRRDPKLRDEALDVLATDGLPGAWERYWRPLFGPQVPPEVVERGWRTTLALGEKAITAGVRAFHSRPDRSDFLSSWKKPVRVVSGEYDIRPEQSRRLADQLPNAHFHLINRAGHYAPLEAPDSLETIVADVVRQHRRTAR